MQKLCGILLVTACFATVNGQTSLPKTPPVDETAPAYFDATTVSNPGTQPALVLKDIPDPDSAPSVAHPLGNIALPTTTLPAQFPDQSSVKRIFRYITSPFDATIARFNFVNRFPDPAIVATATPGTPRIQQFTASQHPGAENYWGYGFDNNYERVHGRWTFGIWYGDHTLNEQSFNGFPTQ